MPDLSCLMMFQVPVSDPVSGQDLHYLMIGVVVIAAALAVQAAGFVVAGIMAAKLLKRIDGIIEDVDKKTSPILAKTNALFDDLGPKVRSVSTNVEQISYTVRAKTDEIGETVTQINRTVQDINSKTRVQADHVNGMVTKALNTTEEVSNSVQRGIKAPIKQVAGVIAGIKAGLETLAEKSPFGKKDMRNPYDM